MSESSVATERKTPNFERPKKSIMKCSPKKLAKPNTPANQRKTPIGYINLEQQFEKIKMKNGDTDTIDDIIESTRIHTEQSPHKAMLKKSNSESSLQNEILDDQENDTSKFEINNENQSRNIEKPKNNKTTNSSIKKEKTSSTKDNQPNQDFIVAQYDRLLNETQQKLRQVNDENSLLELTISKNYDVVEKLINRMYLTRN